jgi:uncharacterized membrane protein YgaE (UPF0421/DUF939 family)
MSASTRDIEAALASVASWLVRRLPADGIRLRSALWPIAQTSLAASLAFYIAHSLAGHVQPFFAPIAAAISMSTSNDQRVQRAVQLVFGVVLGIAIGVGVEALLGAGPAALGVAVFLSLCMALVVGHGFLAQGMMFANQMVAAAILIITVHTSAEGLDRLIDALIGGGVAVVFSLLLFPPDPVPVIRGAVQSVFAVCGQELRQLDELLTSGGPADQGWILSASERIGRAMAGLDQARATAREIVRLAPRRRSSKAVVARADQSAADFAVLAIAVLALGSLTVTAVDTGEPLPAELKESIGALWAALAAIVERGGAGAAEASTAAARAAISAERVLPASITHAAVIASSAAKCAGLMRRAADPS